MVFFVDDGERRVRFVGIRVEIDVSVAAYGTARIRYSQNREIELRAERTRIWDSRSKELPCCPFASCRSSAPPVAAYSEPQLCCEMALRRHSLIIDQSKLHLIQD